MNTPLVVNLFAAPGSGKSTTASGVFYNLKNFGINAELTCEYAKDLTWEKRRNTLLDQIYVFGKQHHRVWRLKEDCSVIISDSPILLGLTYASHYPQCFRDTVKWAFHQYNNINFLLHRVKPYNPKGRNQSEEESNEKHIEICKMLQEMNVDFEETFGNDQGVQTITERIMQKIKPV